MMKRRSTFITLSLMILLSAISVTALAQQRPYRVSDRQLDQLLRRIETRADAFQASLAQALNRSRTNGTNRESEINNYVRDFEAATDRLRSNFNGRTTSASDVEEVLSRGWAINNFVKNNNLGYPAAGNWNNLRSDLRTLAGYYNVSWRWDDTTYNPYPSGSGSNYPGSGNQYPNNPGRGGYGNSRQLEGTYVLDTGRSDNVRTVIDRAIRGQDTQNSQRMRTSLERRLAAPEKLALDRSGRSITMVSSTAPQVTFDADGREQTETRGNGRTVSTTATLNGDRLIIESKGDRGNDYYLMFDPIDNGRALRVTRRFDNERLTTPVEVVSVYRKTDNTAQLSIYEGGRGNYPGSGSNTYPGRGSSYPGRGSGGFSVPNGTTLTATLNTDLTSQQTREGDRFTMNVTSPSQYNGAVIEGTVSNIERSGRIAGRSDLTLNFQTIRFRNGSTSDFAGFIDQVRTTDGEKVTVDNEGTVQDSSSQTTRTVTRSGIGAAIGAIIGGITGGGQGAAIGAAVGAGAGAGTVLVQGRNDIRLLRGTEFTIRSSAPRTVDQ
jgi:outer membrane lipoprotein SlyB